MRFRLYPTPEQEELLLRNCAQARYVWNLALEQHNWFRRRLGSTPNLSEVCRQLSQARKESDWLASGSATVQQQALRDLDQALRNWWSNPGHFGRPKWRVKVRHEGFRVTGAQNWRLERLSRRRGRVLIPKVGLVNFRWSRDPGEAKSYRVRRDSAGRWWISFASIPEPLEAPGAGRAVGVDRGVITPFATSDGDMHKLPGLTEREEVRLLSLEQRLAGQQKGSRRREKTKRAIARLRHKGINRRKDAVEKLTTQLARGYDQIVIEDLNLKGMTRSAKGTIERPGTNVARKAGLNREILKAGWGLFERRLEDKAPGRVVKVNPAFTSQTCNACGHIDQSSRESQALFKCRACGHKENADINAARNILAAGQAASARKGSGLRPVSRPRTSAKPLLV